MNNKALVNKVSVAGKLYSTNLTMSTVMNKDSKFYGVNYIRGSISVATDAECTNIVEANFTFVPESRKGVPNRTYNDLIRLLEEDKTVESIGIDEALLVRVDGQFETNDFFSARTQEVVETTRISGSFVSVINKLPAKPNFFNLAFLYKGYKLPEDEGDIKVSGAGFSFRGELIPITLTFKMDDVSYWDSLQDGEPHLIKVSGHIDMCNVELQQETEGVFGPIVKTITRRKKDYVIENVEPTELIVGTDGVITTEEIKQAAQDRQVHLATVKTDYEEYQKRISAPVAEAPMSGIKTSDFGF